MGAVCSCSTGKQVHKQAEEPPATVTWTGLLELQNAQGMPCGVPGTFDSITKLAGGYDGIIRVTARVISSSKRRCLEALLARTPQSPMHIY